MACCNGESSTSAFGGDRLPSAISVAPEEESSIVSLVAASTDAATQPDDDFPPGDELSGLLSRRCFVVVVTFFTLSETVLSLRKIKKYTHIYLLVIRTKGRAFL